MKKTSERVHEFFCSLIGTGKQFERRTELSDFLHIPRSKATKLFDFLDGKEPKYKAVFDWLDTLGARLILPGDDAGQPSVDCIKQLDDARNTISELRRFVLTVISKTTKKEGEDGGDGPHRKMMEGERMLTKKQKMNMAKDIVLREIHSYYPTLSDAERDVEEMTARKIYQLAFAFCKNVTGLSWKKYCEEVEERIARRAAA